MAKHSLQMVQPGDARLFNPSRDVAHNFGSVFTHAVKKLEAKNWDELVEYLNTFGVEDEELAKAAPSFVNFMLQGPKTPEDMEEALQQAGWFEVAPHARFAFLACLGLTIAGVYQAGVRDACGLGPTTVKMNEEELLTCAQEAYDRLSRPTLKSRWSRFKKWLSNLFDATDTHPIC